MNKLLSKLKVEIIFYIALFIFVAQFFSHYGGDSLAYSRFCYQQIGKTDPIITYSVNFV